MSNYLDLHFLQAAQVEAKSRALDDAQYVAEYGDTRWNINNSTWTDYSSEVYFPGLRQTLDEVVMSIESTATAGLDIAGGSDGKAMLELLERGVLGRAAVTNYQDTRPVQTRNESRLDHIAGDLRAISTWRAIVDWQKQVAASGLKLIVHQPRNTLQWHSPQVYLGAAHTLLDTLAPAGVFVTQVPRSLSRHQQNKVCVDLNKRPDVAATFMSRKHGGYSQALVIKRP